MAGIRVETPQARTITFEVPPGEREPFRYQPGQFLTLRADLDGEQVTRCYSLSTAPVIDPLPAITVKRIEGGRMSSWLCDQVRVGDLIDVRPPDGRFTVPDRPGDLLLFAAGSGITPVWSIVQHAYATTDRRIRLVYVNRSAEDTILRGPIHDLRDRGGRRFRLIERVGGREGRLDTRDVQAYCDGRTDGLFFVCGPWGFMDVVEEGLLDMGVEPDDVHVERFASPRERHGPAVEIQASTGPVATMAGAAADPSVVAVDLFGVERELRCASDQTLTEAALAADVDLPSSCEEGYCGTCMCELVEGEVALDVDDALSKGQRKRGLILACQARPRSPSLRIRYTQQ